MNFIHEHKFTTIVCSILLVLVILGVVFLRILIPNYSGNLYGNRLKNIENYKIKDDQISNLKKDIKGLDGVDSVGYNLEGRLINITIKVSDDVGVDTAKEYANKSLEYFSDKEKEYYDIEIILSSVNNNSEVYPLFGYKHKTSTSIVWSNN